MAPGTTTTTRGDVDGTWWPKCRQPATGGLRAVVVGTAAAGERISDGGGQAGGGDGEERVETAHGESRRSLVRACVLARIPTCVAAPSRAPFVIFRPRAPSPPSACGVLASGGVPPAKKLLLASGRGDGSGSESRRLQLRAESLLGCRLGRDQAASSAHDVAACILSIYPPIAGDPSVPSQRPSGCNLVSTTGLDEQNTGAARYFS